MDTNFDSIELSVQVSLKQQRLSFSERKNISIYIKLLKWYLRYHEITSSVGSMLLDVGTPFIILNPKQIHNLHVLMYRNHIYEITSQQNSKILIG